MKDLPGLRFRFTDHPTIEMPVEVLMELFNRIKDRASPVIAMRQYLKNPMRLDDLSEIELAAIVSVVQTVRQEGPPVIAPIDIVKITELSREWVKACYKAWGKAQARRVFEVRSISSSQTNAPDDSIKSGEISPQS